MLLLKSCIPGSVFSTDEEINTHTHPQGTESQENRSPCGVAAHGNNCSGVSAHAWGLPDKSDYK